VELELKVDILPQPDDLTCGPTCLHAIYSYYGEDLPLAQVITEVPQLETGGTLVVHLACHALLRGYEATIYTYNLQLFDPTWFHPGRYDLAERLIAQKKVKDSPRLHLSTDAYLKFLELGGEIRFDDLSTSLIRRFLTHGVPILTGLSATYLYRDPREYGPKPRDDNIRGYPAGHFVLLCGYSRFNREVLVVDPFQTNPLFRRNKYWLSVERVIGAILLGIITYDANLLILQPKKARSSTHADHHRGQ
jgi:hypothetical protein